MFVPTRFIRKTRTLLTIGFDMAKTRKRSNLVVADTINSTTSDPPNRIAAAKPTNPQSPPSDLPVHAFSSAEKFENFLENNHDTLPGFHLKLAKKSSGIASVTPTDAVEIALCFGWIDGRAGSIDDNYWSVRYTPRRSKSIWSQKNVNTATRLLDEGRMRPAGIATVEAAKSDGRWERAYAGPKDIVEPEDFNEVLGQNKVAQAFFESLNKSDRYSVLWRVQTASPTARQGRIQALVDGLAVGKIPGKETKSKNATDSVPRTNSVAKTTVRGKRVLMKTANDSTKQVTASRDKRLREQPPGSSRVTRKMKTEK